MKRQFAYVLTVFICITAVSCRRTVAPEFPNDGNIHVTVSAEGSTKATIISSETISSSPGKFVLDAYADQDIFDPNDLSHKVKSVGNPYINSDGVPNVYFDNNGTPGTSSDDNWKFKHLENSVLKTDTYTWVSSLATLSFWSRTESVNGLNPITVLPNECALYNTSENLDSEKGVKLVFNYSLPAPVKQTNPSATSLTDAQNQEDLLFAYNLEQLTEAQETDPENNVHEPVKIHFYHALSQIRFAVSNDDNSFDSNVIIESISLSGILPSGKCTFWGDVARTETAKNSAASRLVGTIFSWTPSGEAKTWSQDYPLTIKDSYSSAELSTMASTWNAGQYKNTALDKTCALYTSKEVFMMIPQALTDNACIRLKIKDLNKPVEQQEQEFVSRISFPRIVDDVTVRDSWEAGKYYTYKLNYSSNQISFSAKLIDWGNLTDGGTYNL